MGQVDSYYDKYWQQGVAGWKITAGLSGAMHNLLTLECAGVKVLDFGGGDGDRYGQLIRERASRYTVADVSTAVLERRKALGEHGVHVDNLDQHHAEFDIVLMLEVAEHLLDPVSSLRLAVLAVRPGGRVIISVPNAFTLTNRIRMMVGRLPSSGLGVGLGGRTYIAPHIRFFDERSLRLLARDAGVVVEDVVGDGRDYGPHRLLQKESGSTTSVRRLFTNTLVLLGRVPQA